MVPDRRCCYNFWTESWAETGRSLRRGNLTGLKGVVSEGLKEAKENAESWRKGDWRSLLYIIKEYLAKLLLPQYGKNENVPNELRI